MERRLTLVAIALFPLLAFFASARGVTAAAHTSDSNWAQRDRAVYVVSTLNLLHARNGRLLITVFTHKLGVTHYDVFADGGVSDLYFVELKREDGSSAGALAYQMGWLAPMSVSTSLDRLHVRHAPATAATAYRTDAKQLIGSFTSTISS